MSVYPFPLVAWKPLTEKQRAFLRRCQECQNPEIMYRQAVIDYFSGKRLESGLRYLQRAANLKHIGAMYATCIVLLFSGDNESRESGVKMLEGMKNCMRRELKVHRDKLMNMLRSIWVENPLLRKAGWSDDEEDVCCEACSADSEIRFLSSIFPQW
ncbi:hypothetical protein CDL12_03766 [Handroanthus impetiginosus]|uniref:At2g35280-like TPR domain-containing protein n=1 Tax=Handroanthus impetiginosus TaxID=429701 RepID=A0A2G9I176_9LAMI|nr:hypothetical protein CDL12_03766 [Handroanthus impetiginosus]